ncbi:MAG: hypothetical protein RLZZ387_1460 [Chloroflexota bacterium]
MRQVITRRAFLRAVAAGSGLLGAAQLLAACGAPEPAALPPPMPQAPTATVGPERTIEVWYWDGQIAELVSAFERANPGIAVNLRPNGDVQEGLLRALKSGLGLPDVCAFNESVAAELAQQGGMLDLAAPPFDGAALQSDFVPSAWAGGRSAQGGLVGLPMSVYPGSFWYRADILADAGMESAPEKVREQAESWESLLTLAQELKQRRPGSSLLADAAGDVFFTSWLQQGAAWLDGGKVMIEERFLPAAERAAFVRRQGLDADLAPGGSAFDEAMREGAIAGLFAPAWFQGYISEIHFNQVGKWRVIRAPGGDFNQGSAYLGIPAAYAKQEAAWAFVRYCCASVEGQNTFLKTSGDLPAYTPAWRDPLYDAPAAFFGDQQTYRLWADIAASAPPLRATPHDRVLFEVMGKHVRDLLAAGGDPARALADAEAELVRTIPELTT